MARHVVLVHIYMLKTLCRYALKRILCRYALKPFPWRAMGICVHVFERERERKREREREKVCVFVYVYMHMYTTAQTRRHTHVCTQNTLAYRCQQHNVCLFTVECGNVCVRQRESERESVCLYIYIHI